MYVRSDVEVTGNDADVHVLRALTAQADSTYGQRG